MTSANWKSILIFLLISLSISLVVALPIYFLVDESISMNIIFYAFGIFLFFDLLVYLGFIYKVKVKHKKWGDDFPVTSIEIERMTGKSHSTSDEYKEVELLKGWDTFNKVLAISIGIFIVMIIQLIMYYA